MASEKVIEQMNQKIGEDLGVEIQIEQVGTGKSDSKKKYFQKMNQKEKKNITKARAASVRSGDSILDIMNKELSVKAADSGEVIAEEKQNYEEILRTNKLITVTFGSYDAKGNYEAVDGDKLIILEDAEMRKYGQENSFKQKTIFLNRPICVKVLRIDGNCVYVTPAGSTEYALKHSTKELINSEIERSLANGNSPVVFGRVISVRPNSITVNILDADIIGFLSRSNWSALYTRTMEGICKEGDYFQFEVVRRADKKEGTNAKVWRLSRKKIAPNPWDFVNMETLQEGNILVVKCTEKPEGKSYWWGVTDRLPGVEVMGDFTFNYAKNKGMFVGLSYQCKVDKIVKNTKNNGYNVKVVPISVIEEDRAYMDSIHRKMGGKNGGGK